MILKISIKYFPLAHRTLDLLSLSRKQYPVQKGMLCVRNTRNTVFLVHPLKQYHFRQEMKSAEGRMWVQITQLEFPGVASSVPSQWVLPTQPSRSYVKETGLTTFLARYLLHWRESLLQAQPKRTSHCLQSNIYIQWKKVNTSRSSINMKILTHKHFKKAGVKTTVKDMISHLKLINILCNSNF